MGNWRIVDILLGKWKYSPESVAKATISVIEEQKEAHRQLQNIYAVEMHRFSRDSDRYFGQAREHYSWLGRVRNVCKNEGRPLPTQLLEERTTVLKESLRKFRLSSLKHRLVGEILGRRLSAMMKAVEALTDRRQELIVEACQFQDRLRSTPPDLTSMSALTVETSMDEYKELFREGCDTAEAAINNEDPSVVKEFLAKHQLHEVLTDWEYLLSSDEEFWMARLQEKLDAEIERKQRDTEGEEAQAGELPNEDQNGDSQESNGAVGDELNRMTQTENESPKRVFIIHGHDEQARKNLEHLILRIGCDPIVFAKMSGKGSRTNIEILEEVLPDANAVVALLTPDDEGRKRGTEQALEPRARENVLVESGYALIQRRKYSIIVALGGVSIPSDFHGINRIQRDSWDLEVEVDLVKELAEILDISIDVTNLW